VHFVGSVLRIHPVYNDNLTQQTAVVVTFQAGV